MLLDHAAPAAALHGRSEPACCRARLELLCLMLGTIPVAVITPSDMMLGSTRATPATIVAAIAVLVLWLTLLRYGAPENRSTTAVPLRVASAPAASLLLEDLLVDCCTSELLLWLLPRVAAKQGAL